MYIRKKRKAMVIYTPAVVAEKEGEGIWSQL
jgi:hypothetical protein